MTRPMVLALALLTCASGARSQTAAEIVQRSEDLLKGASSKGKFRMTVTTPEFSRSMEMDSWWVGNEKALIVVTEPRREAGNKTLKVNNELWMYLRNTETTIKVPPSMMLQSWNGTPATWTSPLTTASSPWPAPSNGPTRRGASNRALAM